jgi:hypothetical protein
LEDATYLALNKSPNYAVYPATLSIEDIVSGVKKAAGALPEEAAEEVRQKTVRILTGSCNLKDNLMGQGRTSLRSLKAMCILHDIKSYSCWTPLAFYHLTVKVTL